MHAERVQSPIGFAPLLVLCTLAVVLLFLGGAAYVVIISALLAYILDPVVSALESCGIRRAGAALIVLAVITISVVLAGIWLVPVFLGEVQNLQAGTMPGRSATSIERLQQECREFLSPFGFGDWDLLGRIEAAKSKMGDSIWEFLVEDSILLVLSIVATPFMMFFILKDGRQMKKRFVELVPNRYFEFTMDLLHKMDTQLGNYLRSQFVDAVVFGALSTLALWILGVPYFLFIGVFSGLANLIPYFGPLAGALVGSVVAVMSSGSLSSGVRVAIAYAILKILDDIIVQPFVVSRGVELHPMVVLVAIMVGHGLFGILGMLLAVPIIGFLKVVLRESLGTFRKYRFT